MQPPRLILPLAAVALAATASAQVNWADDFESYASPSALEGQGGWKGWDAVNTTFTQVQSAFASTGQNSIEVGIGADTVHEYANITSGVWNYTGYVYTPTGYDGRLSYMIMNEYSDGGLKQWGSEVQFRGQQGDVNCLCGGSNPTVPIVYDQWVEIRKRIDLTNDFCEIWYDGQIIAAYIWTDGAGGNSNHATAAIEAVDIYPWPTIGSTAMFVDDLSLIEETGQLGTSFECTSTVPNSTNLPGIITATGSDAVANNDVTLTASQLPPNQFGYFLNSPLMNSAGFVPPGSQGRLCIGPASIGRYNLPSQIYNTGAVGEGVLVLDLANTPIPTAPFSTAVQPGETWYFTSWYRDSNPSPTSNFTDAVCIAFQ